MASCTVSGVTTTYEQIASRSGCPKSQTHLFAIHCCGKCGKCANHSAMTIGQKRIFIKLVFARTGHNSESFLGRNDTPLRCLRLVVNM